MEKATRAQPERSSRASNPPEPLPQAAKPSGNGKLPLPKKKAKVAETAMVTQPQSNGGLRTELKWGAEAILFRDANDAIHVRAHSNESPDQFSVAAAPDGGPMGQLKVLRVRRSFLIATKELNSEASSAAIASTRRAAAAPTRARRLCAVMQRRRGGD